MKNVTGDKRYEDAISAWIVRHTVGFAHDTDDGAIAGGSGVLVRCRKIGGILTCAHVLDDILSHAKSNRDGKIGIVANGSSGSLLQRVHMKLSDFKSLPMIVKRGGVATEREQELGPDLGFVRLPETTMSALEAIGSALDLDQQKTMRSPQPRTGVVQALTLAVGNWAELVTVSEHSALNKVATFTTAIVSGEGRPESPHSGYDRFRLEVHPLESYPRSYAGLSGGGVWIVGLNTDDGKVTVVERRLVGIAYFQTGADNPSQRHILLHGPTSIYDQLLPEIETLAATA